MGNCFCISAVKSLSPTTTALSSPGFSAPSNKVAATNDGPDVTNPNGPECEGQILEVPNLKIFTFNELKIATKQFKPQSYLGEGGFGKVYKGWVDQKTLKPIKAGPGALIVAVKKADPESVQGIREWQSEVNFLGRLSHPNLLKLLGYCCEDRELLLVYEFMPKGSLDNHLFGRRAAFQPLSWETRMKIAIGAAQGLAFLHSLEKQIIYRDFKSANILLDSNFNVKLSDFGLATNGPAAGISHITTQVKGTYGYAAPEYIATGHLYVKSDVYTFGVVLLEIITGLQALDNNRPNGMENLVDYAKPILLDRKKIPGIIDPRLEGKYPSKAAFKAIQLALRCISNDPKARPSMKEALDNLLEIESMKKSQKSKAQSTRPRVHSNNPTPGRRFPLPSRNYVG